MNSAVLEVRAGHFDRALLATRKALELFERANELRGRVPALSNLCFQYSYAGQPAEALRYGEEALQMAGRDRPDFAIMDIRLAGDRSGVDTAIELFQSHGIRCIFASAYSDDEARRRAETASPLGWLQKPYTMQALTGMVLSASKLIRDGN